jgi:hypothetical protein
MGAHSPQNSARACRIPDDRMRSPGPAALFVTQAPANTPPGITGAVHRGVRPAFLAEADVKGVTPASIVLDWQGQGRLSIHRLARMIAPR